MVNETPLITAPLGILNPKSEQLIDLVVEFLADSTASVGSLSFIVSLDRFDHEEPEPLCVMVDAVFVCD